MVVARVVSAVQLFNAYRPRSTALTLCLKSCGVVMRSKNSIAVVILVHLHELLSEGPHATKVFSRFAPFRLKLLTITLS